jgi:hypothetical protein
MKKLKKKHILELERRGITIGATVTCAVKAKSEIEIKSWDDWEVEQYNSISSIKPIDNGHYCWLYVSKTDTYATVVKLAPKKTNKLYEVNWSSAPEWATAHFFTDTGEGYWVKNKNVQTNNNGSWSPCNGYEKSTFTLPKGLNWAPKGLDWKQSLTYRPEAKTNPTPPIEEINIIQVVNELNITLFEANHHLDAVFELKSNGFEHSISFAGMLLWNSEHEERQFLEETQQYEPMIPFLIRKQQQAIKNLNKLSL